MRGRIFVWKKRKQKLQTHACAYTTHAHTHSLTHSLTFTLDMCAHIARASTRARETFIGRREVWVERIVCTRARRPMWDLHVHTSLALNVWWCLFVRGARIVLHRRRRHQRCERPDYSPKFAPQFVATMALAVEFHEILKRLWPCDDLILPTTNTPTTHTHWKSECLSCGQTRTDTDTRGRS